MSPVLRLLCLGLLLAAAPLRAQTAGAVRGQVRSEDTGTPLPGARVEVLGAERPHSVGTDAAGEYLLRSVPVGRRVIRVTHLGHTPLEVEVAVPAGREVRLDFSLRVEPVALAPVEVRAGGIGGATDTVSAPGAQLGLTAARALESTPGLAELGLGEAARGVPGQEPADPTGVLYVRGAAADLKLVYLDGAPVYAPFPLGGLLEPFTPEVLRSAEAYVGGAPARYDGGLSYVLDLRTRGVRTDRVHSSGALDLLSGRALVEVPLGRRAGVLAAGRAVHGLGTVQPLPYGYGEGLLRADADVGERGRLSLTGFRNGEEVRLESGAAEGDVIAWGSSALSLRYEGALLGGEGELTASRGEFEARLPLQGAAPLLAEGAAERTRLAADLSRSVGEVRLRYGASFDRLEQRYRGRLSRPGAEALGRWTGAAGDAFGLYADAAWHPVPRLRLHGGARADRFSLGASWVLAPRVSATWLASERAALTLAAGRYHQYLRAPEDAILGVTAGAGPLRQVAPLALGRSSHLALSLDQDLGEGVRLGIEGFYKSYDGIPGATSSEASASGVDVWARRDAGRWTGWLGYSLAWAWSLPEGPAPERFAGRHLLSTGAGIPVGERSRIDVRFAYGSGLPYAAIPLGVETQSGTITTGAPRDTGTPEQLSGDAGAPPLLPSPDRAYLRLDLSASRRWSGRWLDTRVDATSYVKLLNTLGWRDALFYRYDRGGDDQLRAIAALPIVPVIGMEWKF